MTPDDLRAWLEQMQYTQEEGAEELGISRSALARMLAGGPVDRRTALACAAIAAGIDSWRK